MKEPRSRINGESARFGTSPANRFAPVLPIGLLLAGVVLSGIVLAMHHKGHKARALAGTSRTESATGSAPDDLAVSSSAKEAAAERKPAPVVSEEQDRQKI